MSQHLAYGIDVRTMCQLERSVGMPETMESYFACDACSLNPSFQWLRYPGRGWQPCKHQQVWVFTLTTQFVCLFRHRHVFYTLCLLLGEVQSVCVVYLLHFRPFKFLDVAMSQSCQCREQCSSLDNRIVTWCCGQYVQFFRRQKLSSAFQLLYVLALGGHIDGQVAIDESLMQRSLKDGEIGGCSIL